MAAFGSLFDGSDRLIGGWESPPTVQNISMGSNEADDRALLNEYVTLRSNTYRNYFQTMTDDERFYRMEFGADLIPPEWRSRGFEPTIPPTAYNAVEAATNHILTTPDILIPERPATSDHLNEQMIAAQKTAFLNFLWHQAFKQGDPLGHGKKDMIKWGRLVLKKTINFESLNPDGVDIGVSAFPWSIVQLSPAQVLEDPNRPYDPRFAYEAYDTTRDEAHRLFPEASGAWLKRDSQDRVRVLEYYSKPEGRSKGRRIIWIEDERVLNKVNPYHWVRGVTKTGAERYTGYVPYFIADSGWGDGDSNAAPHERFVGMIRRIHSLLLTEARQLTAADAQLRIGTFPILNLKNIEEDEEKPIKLGPGAKIHTTDEQDVSTVEWPRLDPALFAIISRVHTYVNELAQFETLSGSPQPGVDSATEADQNFRAANARLGGPVNGIKSIVTRINETAFQDVEHIFEASVTVFGAIDGTAGVVTIEPEWINGFYENYVELKTSDERALDAANAVRWANLYQTFGLDAEYAMRMAGIPNPRQRMVRRKEEDVFNDPRMHEMRVAQALQQQGGPFGSMLAENVIQNMMAGLPTEPVEGGPPGGEGAFQPPALGDPTARDANPALDPGAAPAMQNNAMRGAGFDRAMAQRPDLALRG